MERRLRAFEKDITERKLHTDGLPIGQAGQRVREMTGLSLTGDRRSGPRRRADQLAVQLRSIRLSELLPPLQGRSGFLLPVSLFPEYFLPCIVP